MRPLLRCLAFLALPAALPGAEPVTAATPPEPAVALRQIYAETLARGRTYAQLAELTTAYPGRLAGSASLAGAVRWGEAALRQAGADRVWLQDVSVPHWERGAPESVRLLPPPGTAGAAEPLAAAALGGSVPTPPAGIAAEVIEVHGLAELAQLGREKLAGKIVFFNRPMDPAEPDPGKAYSEAVDQRSRGPITAASYGAVAALVRSMTHAHNNTPHTGGTTYRPETANIPAAALSTVAADRLSAALAATPARRVELRIHSQWHPDAPSHNVIGEIRGTEFPDQVIVVGGHLDSWDLAPGAHDDGAGIVQSIEVLRIFRALGYRPRHTIRCVLFANEENGLRGGKAYAAWVQATGERHVFALESDSGGFGPRSVSLGAASGPLHERAAHWLPLLRPYGILAFTPGTGGADIGPLLPLGVPLGNLETDGQRYFDFHHTVTDSIDQVNPRELALGAGTLAAMIWLVDQQGL